MIVKDVACSYPQYTNAFGEKPVIAAIVVPHLVFNIVMRTINLNG
jgi:hypothetical protein